MVQTEVRYFGWEHHDLWAVLSRNFDSVCSAGIFGICQYDLTCKIMAHVANFHLIFEAIILIFTTKNMMNSINYTLIFNSSNPGSSHSHRKNCVSIAHFSAVMLGPCSCEHDERRLTLALVYMVIDLCVLSRNEKAKFAWKSPASQLSPSGAPATGM